MNAYIKALITPALVVFIYWSGGGDFERGVDLSMTYSFAIGFYVMSVCFIKDMHL